jgi:hypothetical protein
MQSTLFDLHGIERIAAWKEFRHTLDIVSDPIQETVNLWCRAPFVNDFLDINRPETWPGPWELVLDNKYDSLGLALGQLYTLLLTERFSQAKLDILAVTSSDNLSETFVVLVDDTYLLNLEYKTVKSISNITDLKSRIIWSTK